MYSWDASAESRGVDAEGIAVSFRPSVVGYPLHMLVFMLASVFMLWDHAKTNFLLHAGLFLNTLFPDPSGVAYSVCLNKGGVKNIRENSVFYLSF